MENLKTFYFLKVESFLGENIVSKINEIQATEKPKDTSTTKYFDTYSQAKMYQDLVTFKRFL
jgi:hypothetical protein